MARLHLWPVVQRELRESARRPANHRLRLCSAITGTLLVWGWVATVRSFGPLPGAALLGGLHSLVIGLILVVVAPSAADCIAREHREGTLSLLFLTPLDAGGIVAGKAIVQGLRDLTLWLAVLPILTIPFLAGGATWFDAFSALSQEVSAALLCLAAGLLASSLTADRNRAVPLGFVLGVALVFLFSQLQMVALVIGWRGLAGVQGAGWGRFSAEALVLFSGVWPGGGVSAWSSLARVSSRLGRTWETLCWAGPIVSTGLFLSICRFAAVRLDRSWRDAVPSPRRDRLVRRYCSPLFRRRFQQGMRRCRDRNPIAWLQQYSWKSRANKWFLCLAFLLLGFALGASSRPNRGLLDGAMLLTWGGFYLFAAVSGFLEEKRSGALEMLLVTPVSPSQLILGRTWGLWKAFLPAGLVIVLVRAVAPDGIRLDSDDEMRGAVQCGAVAACAFLTLPVFATYFALRVKGLIAASMLTVVATALPTVMGFAAVEWLPGQARFEAVWPPLLLGLSNGAFAVLACRLLQHSLARRIYSF